jgi:hypothetical protein
VGTPLIFICGALRIVQTCRSGSRSTSPSNSGVILIWQDNREFGSRSVAVPSSRSSSSLLTASSLPIQLASTSTFDGLAAASGMLRGVFSSVAKRLRL